MLNVRFWGRFRRRENSRDAKAVTVGESRMMDQLAAGETLSKLQLYDAIRDAVPVVNVAIEKLTRLVSAPRIVFKSNEKLAERFNEIPCGSSAGLGEFVRQMIDAALVKGYAVGEMIPLASGRGIARLAVGKSEDFTFEVQADGSFAIKLRNSLRALTREEAARLVVLSFGTREGKPGGRSLLASLPFVNSILIRALKCIDNQFWRLGDPTFVVYLRGGKGVNEAALKQMRADLESTFTEAMRARKTGMVRDIFGAGPEETTLEVKALAAEHAVMDIEVPYSAVLEQVIASLVLPPFMLGLKRYDARETMAAWQADMVVAHINDYREQVTSMVKKVVDVELALSGNAGAEYSVEWEPVNLMDESQTSLAELRFAQARATEIEALLKLYDSGLITAEVIIEHLRAENIITEKSVTDVLSNIDRSERIKLAARLVRELKDAGGNGKAKREWYLPEQAAI